MPFDLVIRGGHVIDPSQQLDARRDIGIMDGKIAAVEPSLPAEDAEDASRVIDAAGQFVTPGLIDLHVHAFTGTDLGLEMDKIGPISGVTTMVDTGSAGAHTFEAFRRFVIEPSQTRLLPFLNISTIGIISMLLAGELENIRYCNVEEAVRCAQTYRGLIAGIKVRSSGNVLGSNGIVPMELARAAADRLGLPLMVHIGPTPPDIGDILSRLRPGDILTHCFTGHTQRPLAPDGKVRDDLLAARSRGVIMDIGHGMGSLSFDTARQMLRQGFQPDTISTDLHAYSWPSPVQDLPHVLSKFLALGMSLNEVITAATRRPAQILGLSDRLGTLRVGTVADVALFKLERAHNENVAESADSDQRLPFSFIDSYGNHLSGAQHLANTLTIKDRRIWQVPQ